MKHTQCQVCKAFGPAREYHPHAFCLMVIATGNSDGARVNLNAVLDYGRKLERLKLPNDAPISAVRESANSNHTGEE